MIVGITHECMTLAGSTIAQFVYEVAPTEMTFFNPYFDKHAKEKKWLEPVKLIWYDLRKQIR